jgi:general L-amino acid transport system permease protein
MSDVALPTYVRKDLVAERTAPVKTTGFTGFVRTRLLNSPTNILLTITGALLIWFTVIPALRFLLVDAVWQGSDRNACLEQNAGHPVGACWPYIAAKFDQLMYGSYPELERWRVKLTYVLAVVLLIPLLVPRLPGKSLNASLFFLAFPVVAFFLVYGGGLSGFGVSWTANLLSGLAGSFDSAGNALVRAGGTNAFAGPLLALAGKPLALIGTAISFVIWPLTWLRAQMIASGQPVWVDLAVTAAVVSALAYVLGRGWRALIASLSIFAGIAIVIAVMRLDRGGLPIVDTRLWGGLLVTLVISVTGIVASMPIGIALALGRRSTIPLIRIFSIIFIEFWRGVPLITVLFFATYMLPLFLPGNFTVDGLVRALIGTALFAGAYQAEVVRGGLQAIPRGQGEAASCVTSSPASSTASSRCSRTLRWCRSWRCLICSDRCALPSPTRTGRRRARCSPALPSPD